MPSPLRVLPVVLAGLTLLGLACHRKSAEPSALRLGCFANLTHAQALLAKGHGFKADMSGRPVVWRVFNAGPSEMEALMAGELDAAYVGPNPAVNAWLRSGRKGLRVIAGSVSGGAFLITHPKAQIREAKDFRGRRVASPELGNTQDVALRAWLKAQGLEPGRDVKVLPVKNAELILLFMRGELDAAWVPEPWASRLVQDAGGLRFLDEAALWPGGRFTTTLLVAREAWLKARPDEARALLRSHVAWTDWINAHRSEAEGRVRAQLEGIQRTVLPEALFRDAFRGLVFTDDPLTDSVLKSAQSAWSLGFLPSDPGGLEGLFDLSHLREVKGQVGAK